jgi:dihydrofolate reductase
MASVIYSAICSLDGYVADREGNFAWAAPDEEVHAFVNERERAVGTHLLGRRMYEVLVFWETAGADPDLPPVEREYAEIWSATDKIVYSRTLTTVATARTRLERELEPGAVRRLAEQAERDVSVGGPELGAAALRAGVVDEVLLFVCPVVVGGGHPALAPDLRLDLELLDERRFRGGVVYLRYAVRR